MLTSIHSISWHDIRWLNWRYFLLDLGVIALLWYFLRQLRRFVTKHGKTIINGAFWIANRVATRSISAQLSMRRYCHSQLEDEAGRSLQVPGLKGETLDVDEVFVPLTLELGGQDQTLSSSDVLKVGNRLIIVGDPGSGKSTLVKRLHRDACKDTARTPRKGKLPIRLELRTLVPPSKLEGDTEAGDWLFDQLRATVQQVEGFEMTQLFDSWVTDTGILVLFDGLDEVGSERYAHIVAALRGVSRRLASLSSKNTVVVTMRIQFYQQIRVHLIDQYVRTLYVRPFLPNEIYLFLQRWPFKHDKERNISKIYAELTDRPTLREMCRNPLVLAMYVESSLESVAGELPNTRTEFYEKVVNELLVIRRNRQDVVNRATSALRKQREAILGRLAFENLVDPEQPVNLLPWKDAIAVAEEMWQCSPSEAEARLNELANDTGLISQERLGENFRFIHQTFCEFLAAIECAKGRRDGWSDLLTVHRTFVSSGEAQLQVRLLEVIPFALALLQRHQQPGALQEISQLNDRLVVGRCFLETQLYNQAEWTEYVSAEGDHLSISTATEWDEGKLRRLQLFSVVLRDARDWSTEIERKEARSQLDDIFSAIVGDNREIIATVFETYARQDAAAAVRLADQLGVDMLVEHPAIIIDSCQEEPFLALALERVNSESGRDWPRVLIEAALRFANVAHRLDSTPAGESSSPAPVSKRSFSSLLRLCRVKEGSWYEALAQRVIAKETLNEFEFEAVEAFIRCLSHATRNRWTSYLGIVFGTAGAFVIASIEAAILSGHHSQITRIAAFVIGTSLGVVTFFTGWSIYRYIDAIYRDIGNARPFGESVSPFFVRLGVLFVRSFLWTEILVLIGLTALRPDAKAKALSAVMGKRRLQGE